MTLPIIRETEGHVELVISLTVAATRRSIYYQAATLDVQRPLRLSKQGNRATFISSTLKAKASHTINTAVG